jgi:hypothetical protein
MSMPSWLRKVSGSSAAARTSSNRDSAHHPHFSLRYTGASSRIHWYTGYGSAWNRALKGSYSITVAVLTLDLRPSWRCV